MVVALEGNHTAKRAGGEQPFTHRISHISHLSLIAGRGSDYLILQLNGEDLGLWSLVQVGETERLWA